MQKKLMRGLGLKAVLLDADSAGYLGPDESSAVMRARMDFRSYCEGLAAELLKTEPEPAQAKQAVRAAFLRAGAEAGGFSADEAALVGEFEKDLDEAIDVAALWSEPRRSFARLMFRTPTFIKVAVVLAIIFATVEAVLRVFAK